MVARWREQRVNNSCSAVHVYSIYKGRNNGVTPFQILFSVLRVSSTGADAAGLVQRQRNRAVPAIVVQHDVRNDVSDRRTVNYLPFDGLSHREMVNCLSLNGASNSETCFCRSTQLL